MTNVVVAKQRNIRVTTNNTGGVITTNIPVTLKNTPIILGGKLANLQDVVTSNQTNGSTVIYNSDLNKYIIEKLDLAYTIGTLDGGDF